MSTPTPTRRSVLRTTAATVAGLGLGTGTATAAPGNAHGRRHDVTIRTEHDHHANEHRFRLDSRELPTGWTTFTLDNQTEHAHFAALARIPQQAISDATTEGMELLDFYIQTVTKPFQYFMDQVYVDGKDADPSDLEVLFEVYDAGELLFGLFPPWFGDVTFHGGPGLTSGDNSSTTTVALDPGEYIVECYVKDDANDFHSYLGMIDHLTVTTDETDAPEPTPTLSVELTNHGFVTPDRVRPGRHIVGATFAEQQAYANLVGHDLHLVRLTGDTTAEDVNDWMNWADPTQLIADGTEPTAFLGGVADILGPPLPQTGYHHVHLHPGDYAWVAEIPDPQSTGFLHQFKVPGHP